MASGFHWLQTAQLQRNSKDGASNQAALSIQAPAASGFLSYSRQLDFAPQNVRVRNWLKDRDDTFRELDDLREQGWNSPEADIFFETQRDQAGRQTERVVYDHQFMQIGKELRMMGAFDVLDSKSSELSSLNLCMAPGGYTAAILQKYPLGSVSGITLPTEFGGHQMMIPYGSADSRVQVEFMDITMLSREFSDHAIRIPATHPRAANFISQSPFAGKLFDLVVCDGNLVPSFERTGKKASLEPIRLLTAQLVFGMNRIKSGGTFVILLHKADAFDTMQLIKDFCSISESVKLFKPMTAHRKKTSFYMVANGVHSSDSKTQACIAKWRECWTRATFGGADRTGLQPAIPTNAEVDALLDEFGSGLIAMAHDVWKVQAQALKKALDAGFRSPMHRAMQFNAQSSSSGESAPRYTVPGKRATMAASSPGPRPQISPFMTRKENNPFHQNDSQPSKTNGKELLTTPSRLQARPTEKQMEIEKASSWRRPA
ncbi:MAG: hypothetical protein Q9207_004232 [Kuettlingeria erythrocarpa]